MARRERQSITKRIRYKNNYMIISVQLSACIDRTVVCFLCCTILSGINRLFVSAAVAASFFGRETWTVAARVDA